MKSPKLLSHLFPAGALALAAISSASAQYLDWPMGDNVPGNSGTGYFNWTPLTTDNFADTAILDLSYLNEDVAGQDGWIQQVDDQFFLPDGSPVRFWSVNITGNQTINSMTYQARFLAKHGVNMIRVHGGASKSLFDPNAASLFAVRSDVIDQMHKAVAAYKEQGIYTFVSNTLFIVELHMKASYGIEGYTADWLAANPNEDVPFGLLFFNPTMQDAFKTWVTALLSRPNPYVPNETPLAEDTSVAILEILNEDNVFFNTFDPADFPQAQQTLIRKQFFQFVADKYRDPENTSETDQQIVQRVFDDIYGRAPSAADDIPNGELEIFTALRARLFASIGLGKGIDYLHFISHQQKSFFEDVITLARDLGYQGAVSPSNWRTVADLYLRDLDFYTYAVGETIDVHNYFNTLVSTESQFYAINTGDQYLPYPAVLDPRASPVIYKQVDARTSSLSESTWTTFSTVTAEAPILTSAYGAHFDLDTYVWFALDTFTWDTRARRWLVGTPSLMGQFPGAALLYRRGDIARAPIVIREGKTPQSLYEAEAARILPSTGFDAFRDTGGVTPADTELDQISMLVGEVELGFDTDTDFVSPLLSELVDYENSRVTNMTGELTLDWDDGLLSIHSPTAQGATGFLKANSPIETEQLIIDSSNNFGTVLAVSLDGLPLDESTEILVQTATSDRRQGFNVLPIEMTYQSRGYVGYQIQGLGTSAWSVEQISADLTLKGLGDRVESISVLNEDGYVDGTVTPVIANGDASYALPATSIYSVVNLSPAANHTPRARTYALPHGRIGEVYSQTLNAISGDGNLSWSVSDNPGPLPAGLSLNASGQLEGTPTQGGVYRFSLEVADEDGDSHSIVSQMLVLPFPEDALFGVPLNEPRLVGIGWVYDLYTPWLWLYSPARWAYVWPGSTLSSIYLYVDEPGSPYWVYMNNEWGGWYYRFDTQQWSNW